jgi:hypothetical protein
MGAYACVRVIVRPCVHPVTELYYKTPVEVDPDPEDTIPANAIYANGEAIPDPSGTGYLTYEV